MGTALAQCFQPLVSGTKRPRSHHRRQQILEAALGCFLEKGVEGTTVEEIRARSGASVGSIYHLFAGKGAIAGELYLGSLRSLHELLLDGVNNAPDAEAALRGAVVRYLDWVVREPDRARFLFQERRAAVTGAVQQELQTQTRSFLRGMRDAIARFVESGELRRVPLDLFIVVVLGPMQEYARQHLAGTAKTPPQRAAKELGRAAWAALRATR